MNLAAPDPALRIERDCSGGITNQRIGGLLDPGILIESRRGSGIVVEPLTPEQLTQEPLWPVSTDPDVDAES